MKVNYRQTCVLLLLSMIAMKLVGLPGLMYNHAQNMSFIVVFVMMSIDVVYAIMLLSVAEKCGNRNMFEFLNKILGPVITRIFIFLLIFNFMGTIIIQCKGLEFFVIENLYSDFAWYLFMLPLAGIVCFMAYKGIQNIARVCEVLCWLIIFGVIYIGLKGTGNSDIGFMLPFFEEGLTPLFKGAYTLSSFFGSSLFLLILFGNIDFQQKKPSKLWKYLIIGVVLVQFIYIVFYGLFEVTSPAHPYCLSEISQFSSVHNAIDELSWFVVSFWIVEQILVLSLNIYCLSKCIQYTFNTKSTVIPLTIIGFGLLFWGFIGQRVIRADLIFYHDAFIAVQLFTQYVIPLIVFFAHLVNSRKQKMINKNNNQNLFVEDKKESGNGKKKVKNNI